LMRVDLPVPDAPVMMFMTPGSSFTSRPVLADGRAIVH
jgi:hypothetical protein